MKCAVIFVLCLLISVRSFSQKDFAEGYLVDSSRDTLRGFILDHSDRRFGQNIQFKKSLQDNALDYPLESVRSIYLKPYDDYYFSRTLSIDKKPNRPENLEIGSARHIVVETVMIRLIAGGKINLYSYLDEDKKLHFFVEKGEKTEELEDVKFLTNDRAPAELKIYVGTLISLTSDCPKVVVGNLDLQESSLKRLVDKYNACFSTTAYVRKKEKTRLQVGVLLGGKSSQYMYIGTDNTINNAYSIPSATAVNFGSTTTGIIGIYADLLSARTTNPYVAGFQLLYQQSGSFSGSLHQPNSYDKSYSTKLAWVTTGINVKYYPLKRKNFPLYLKVGIGLDIVTSSNAAAVYNDLSTAFSTRTAKFIDYASSGLDYNIGLGASFNRAFVEVLYQHDGFSGGPESSVTLVGYSLVVGYRIFGK